MFSVTNVKQWYITHGCRAILEIYQAHAFLFMFFIVEHGMDGAPSNFWKSKLLPPSNACHNFLQACMTLALCWVSRFLWFPGKGVTWSVLKVCCEMTHVCCAMYLSVLHNVPCVLRSVLECIAQCPRGVVQCPKCVAQCPRYVAQCPWCVAQCPRCVARCPRLMT